MRDVLTGTIDPRPLAVTRILVGLGSLPLAIEWVRPMIRGANGERVQVPSFEGLPPVTFPFAAALFAVAVVAGLLLMIGVQTRVAAVGVAATAITALIVEQQTWSNHLLLLTLLATYLACSGAGEALSARRRRGADQVPYWPAFLIKLLISTVYAWTAISKINSSYLAGEVVEKSLHDWLPIPDALMPVGAIGSILLEAFLAVALWVPWVRLLGFVAGAGLHIGFAMLLTSPAPLIPFGVLMASGYALFLWDARYEVARIMPAPVRARIS